MADLVRDVFAGFGFDIAEFFIGSHPFACVVVNSCVEFFKVMPVCHLFNWNLKVYSGIEPSIDCLLIIWVHWWDTQIINIDIR